MAHMARTTRMAAFPAYAGMNRHKIQKKQVNCCVPRVCGDEPRAVFVA